MNASLALHMRTHAHTHTYTHTHKRALILVRNLSMRTDTVYTNFALQKDDTKFETET